MFVLRVLSELSLVLLVKEGDGGEGDAENTEMEKKRREEGRHEGNSYNQILAHITNSLLPRLVWLYLSIKDLQSQFFCFCRKTSHTLGGYNYTMLPI